MSNVLKELDAAYKLVSSIPVTYDAVDAMAVVRAKLRKVYAELEQASKVTETEAIPETPQE